MEYRTIITVIIVNSDYNKITNKKIYLNSEVYNKHRINTTLNFVRKFEHFSYLN